MAERETLSTAIPGLDRLLGGGLRAGGLHLIAGEPGAGKTVLAHQVGAHHAAAGRSVLYLTAMVESHQTLLSQMRSFSFFDPSIISRTFYYASVSPSLEAGGLAGVREGIARLLLDRRPDLLVLDGLHTLNVMAGSATEYHALLTFLQAQCASTGVTMLVIANREAQDAADPMYTVSDAILVMETEQANRRRVRTMEVRKLRGVQHLTGSHLMHITGDGVSVYPRVEAVASTLRAPFETPVNGRLEFGIPGLDAMVDGGLSGSSVTLVPGPSGVGKTLLAQHFLTAGAAAGEDVLFIGFHETPDRLLDKADGIGLDLRAQVEARRARLHWHARSDLAVDRVAEEVLEEVEQRDVRRVVIDGMNDLLYGLVQPGRKMPFLSAFADLLRSRGTAVLFTGEVPHGSGLSPQLPLPEVSAVVDNIVLLRFLEVGPRLHRLVSILKVRDQPHDTYMRELIITPDGLAVGDAFEVDGRPTGGETGSRHGGPKR
jgi:circadian clock protein KaiC